MTLSGELKVVGSSDLKGLGSREGPAATYQWVMPSFMPVLLPWLAVLGLLALKFNRNASAWSILVPLGLCAGVVLGLRVAGEHLPGSNEAADACGKFAMPVAFGLAAVWLLAPILARRPWPLVFLGTFLIQTLMSLLAHLASADAESMAETVGIAIAVAVFDFGLVLALALAGLVCRKRFGVGRFVGWNTLFLVGGWALAAVPFCLIGLLSSSFGPFIPWWAFPTAAGVIAGGSLILVMPFLILALANTFYGERLKDMFAIPSQTAAPPGLPPTEPTPQPA